MKLFMEIMRWWGRMGAILGILSGTVALAALSVGGWSSMSPETQWQVVRMMTISEVLWCGLYLMESFRLWEHYEEIVKRWMSR